MSPASDLAGLAAREAGAPSEWDRRHIEHSRDPLDALTEANAKLDTVRESLAACVVQRDAAMSALSAAENELANGRPGYSWISDEALAAIAAERDAFRASVQSMEQTMRDACEARDHWYGQHERVRRTLAVEQGREGPEGWEYSFGQGRWIGSVNIGFAYVWRIPWLRADGRDVIAWGWEARRGSELECTDGTAATALEAIMAAERVMKGAT